MSVASWFYLGLLVVGIVLLICYHKAGRLLKCLFFTAFTGIGALGVLWLVGHFVHIPLAVTPLTLLVSGVMGIPGVIAMLIFYLI